MRIANSVRVLLVDDNREDYLIVRALLEGAPGGPYQLDWVRTPTEARAAFAKLPLYEAALVNAIRNQANALNLVREVTAQPGGIPIIVLTESGGPETGDEAIRAGAADYLPKPRLDGDRLAGAIRHAVIRREFEVRLHQGEREARRLAMVATHTDNSVIITDPAGHVEWVNEAFTRLTEYKLEEVRGRKPGDFLQGAGTDHSTIAHMSHRLRAGEGFNAEVLNYTRSGRPCWLRIDCRPIRDDRGQLQGFVAIESDVTASHLAAEEAIEARACIEAAYDATIEGWARALELRDHETEGHSRRVSEMTLRLAKMVGIPRSEWIHIRRGALLHDIGKMGIPDSILRKPGPLDSQERALMMKHPLLGYQMLSAIKFLEPALDIPYCHHERWDGTGYPRGLRGTEIPLSARVFAVVDIWDALSHDRPYRIAWEPSRVREHIRLLAGSHLDPDLVEAFLHLLPGYSAIEVEAGKETKADSNGHRISSQERKPRIPPLRVGQSESRRAAIRPLIPTSGC